MNLIKKMHSGGFGRVRSYCMSLMSVRTYRLWKKIRRKEVVEYSKQRHRNSGIPISVGSLTLTNAARSVTIDSNNVRIVKSLNEGSYDLQCTCIEVDGSSLTNLMVNYRDLINKEGAYAPLMAE